MSGKKQHPKQSPQLKRIGFILAVAWTIVIALILSWNLWEDYTHTLDSARIAAVSSAEKDLVIRRWAASHGGVYIPPTEKTPPSPYLSHIEDRDITATSGKKLTLMNPAYIIRQMYELSFEQYGQQSHITSLIPIRPENAPDEWESEALRVLETGRGEVSSLAWIGDMEYLRMMRPLITEVRCLKCHATQGYGEGDIRGGVSVSVPMAPLWADMYSHMRVIILGYIFIWIIGIGWIYLGSVRLKRHIRQLASKESQIRQLFDEAIYGVALADPETGIVVDCNTAFADLLERDKGEIVGKDQRDFHLADEHVGNNSKTFKEHLGEMEGQTLDSRMTTSSGEIIDVEIRAKLVDFGDKQVLQGFFKDITVRKRAEETLRVSEERFRHVYENMAVGVAQVSMDFQITHANAAYCSMLGYREDELIGKYLKDITHPEDLEENLKKQAQLMAGEIDHYRMEKRFIHKNGDLISGILDASLIRNADGEPLYYLGSVVDITDRISNENEKLQLQKQLQQFLKMEAVGTMASGMAHNFNNNLAIILGNVELAQLKQLQNSEFAPLLKNAKIAALRARDLIQNILTYSREGVHDTDLIHLPLVVNETINLLRSTIPATVNIEQIVHSDCNDATVNADSSQIQEALFNLCNNAVHAMDEKGDLKVLLDTVDLQAQDIPAQYDCLPGRYVKLSVQDSGSGMSAETIDKIFDPFFTTKEVGQGTGMGLSTVQGIIKCHKGLIKVKSTHEGTTFDLYFPVIDKNQKIEIEPEDTTLPGGTEHILFVDDDELLASLGEELLTEMGYRVTTMTDSTKALKIFAANAGQFDLVITDQTMPELSGKELVQELKKIRPDIPTILCTGYSNKVDEETATELGINTFLLKPVNLPELLQTVRRVLDGEKK